MRSRSAAPDAKILVVGQAGRPDPAFVKRLVAHAPAVKADLSGPGICSFYDENGHLVAENFKTLTSIIDAYEAEQARVCAAVPNCVTDGGVRAAYKDKLANFSPDWSHLNVRGQAAEAALIWPVVADLLGALSRRLVTRRRRLGVEGALEHRPQERALEPPDAAGLLADPVGGGEVRVGGEQRPVPLYSARLGKVNSA